MDSDSYTTRAALQPPFHYVLIGAVYVEVNNMGKFIDLTGQKFGRLIVVRRAENKHGRVAWLCKCDCGKEIITTSYLLKSGQSKSCGCYNIDKIIERNTTHGDSKTRLYKEWGAMKERCYRPKHEYYADYGGRGVSVCSEWLDEKSGYKTFKAWAIANGYKDDLTLERKDVNGNYEPSNCKWATRIEQANNKRNSQRYKIDGEYLTIAQIARRYGIKYAKLRDRLKVLHWDINKAVKK